MIITDDFVYIHQPKTGGTFVTRMLQRVYGVERGLWHRLWRRRLPKPVRDSQWLKQVRMPWKPRFVDVKKHGAVCEIPLLYRELPIIGTVRNPYDRFVSQFEFQKAKDMSKESWPEGGRLRDKFLENENWPFDEYVRWRSRHAPPRLRSEVDAQGDLIGLQTKQFVTTYAMDPPRVFNILQEKGAEAVSRGHFAPMRFLETGNLNEDLYSTLRDFAFPEEKLEFILRAKKVRPPRSTRTLEQTWQRYYDEELLDYVRCTEKLLFELFPSFVL